MHSVEESITDRNIRITAQTITDTSLEFPYLVNKCTALENLSDVVKPKLYSIYNKYADLAGSSYNAASCRFEEEQLLNCVCAYTRRFSHSDIKKLFHKLYLKYTPDGDWCI